MATEQSGVRDKALTTTQPASVELESPSNETALETANRIERAVQLGALEHPETAKAADGQLITEVRRQLAERDIEERKATEAKRDELARKHRQDTQDDVRESREGFRILADPGSSTVRIVKDAPPKEEATATDAGEEEELPADFPARPALMAAGLSTLNSIRGATDDQLLAVPGLKDTELPAIRSYMAALDSASDRSGDRESAEEAAALREQASREAEQDQQ